MVFFMLYKMVFIKVLVYLSSATCTMNLQNPKNGSKLPSRDFANTRTVRRYATATVQTLTDNLK